MRPHRQQRVAVAHGVEPVLSRRAGEILCPCRMSREAHAKDAIAARIQIAAHKQKLRRKPRKAVHEQDAPLAAGHEKRLCSR